MTKKNLKRGEVYYIEGAKEAAGSEMVKTRPGIVISDQNQVENSHVVTVVYLSHQKQETAAWKAKAESYKAVILESMGGRSCGKK